MAEHLLRRAILFAAFLIGFVPLAAARAEERVSFPSLDGDLTGGHPTAIPAVLYRPRGTGPFPAVVAMHGCGGLFRFSGKHKGEVVERNADWAERLASDGFVVLLPDSFGPRGVHESCTVKDRPVDSRRERPRDAYGALVWLQSQPFVKPDRIAILGWSNGGGTVLATVASDFPGRPATLAKGDFRAAVAFYPGCSDPKASRSARDWRTRIPLMILNGEADDWTPAAPCQGLVSAAVSRGEPVELHLYPGAYHDFDAPDMRVHERTGLARAPTGRAHVGTNPAARADALKRVPEFLHAKLGGI